MAVSNPPLDVNRLILEANELSLRSPQAVSSSPQQSSRQTKTSPGAGGCSYDAAFQFLAEHVKLPGLKVVCQLGVGGRLIISPPGIGIGKDKTIVIDCSEVPCFVESIPEMLTSYIIAQLLRIAASTPTDMESTVKTVNLNIQSKILVLQQISKFHDTPIRVR